MMNPRLKSLELQGYKTFASRTLFEFAGAVTAIVGPNGSGKSNIADSLRWVLGEQSYSLLRGKRTEDMIFSGSEQRSRAGMASAAVVFDNTSGWLPIDYSEVAIARRAYRDGSNEYLINGQRVRLRDVGELLAQSGLAERTYTIIGQGVVDAALALKAEERRRLFEEAAGIGLHRSRREEAFRRLDITRRNLERVQDILAELQPRLRSLERQARRAQEYEQVRADLQVILREWYGFHWHRAQQELAEAREFARTQEKELMQAHQEADNLEQKLFASRDHIQALRARLNSWHRHIATLHTQREVLSRELAVGDERIRSQIKAREDLSTELARLEEEDGLHRERLNAIIQEEERLQEELSEAHAQVGATTQALNARQNQRQTADNSLQHARQDLSVLIERQSQLKARQAESLAAAASQDEALNASRESSERLASDLKVARERLLIADRTLDEANSAHQAITDHLRTHYAHQADLEAARQEMQEQCDALTTEATRLRAQLEVIDQAEVALQGYTEGAQVLIKAAREALLNAPHGALGGRLEVPHELEAAIAAALGEYLDAVPVADPSDSDTALDLLTGGAARGVILPLDSLLTPALLPDGWQAEGVLGLASELVSAPPELRPALDLLLGRTLVVQERQVARQVLSRLRQTVEGVIDVRAVTLSGELFLASGPQAGGWSGKASTISRSRQRKELLQKQSRLDTQLARLEGRLDDLRVELDSARKHGERQQQASEEALKTVKQAVNERERQNEMLTQLERELNWGIEQARRLEVEIDQAEARAQAYATELAQLDEQVAKSRHALRNLEHNLAELTIDDLQSQAAHWRALAGAAERAVIGINQRRLAQQSLLARAKSNLASVRERMEQAESSLEELESGKPSQRQEEIALSEQIEALSRLIEPAEAELQEAEALQLERQDQETNLRQALTSAEHHNAQARINLARRQEALETWRRRIEDDFGLVNFEYADEISGPTPLPLQGLVEQLPVIKKLAPEIEDNVRRQRAQLRRMGPVNPEAQTEFQEVKERFGFMTEQVADLQKAENDVREVIAELDQMMERELRRTFDAVAEEFGAIFKRLFGGGSARLLLTDPDDMNNSGVEIEARLPGRRSQGLSLLSGGERSLTATALVFSLLKVSPTPFCVLDEVDAMLDEANVGRFRELLRELSQETQFVIVTHNRNTVQVADVIYGVTMGHDSVSQVISLKLDEVGTVVD